MTTPTPITLPTTGQKPYDVTLNAAIRAVRDAADQAAVLGRNAGTSTTALSSRLTTAENLLAQLSSQTATLSTQVGSKADGQVVTQALNSISGQIETLRDQVIELQEQVNGGGGPAAPIEVYRESWTAPDDAAAWPANWTVTPRTGTVSVVAGTGAMQAAATAWASAPTVFLNDLEPPLTDLDVTITAILDDLSQQYPRLVIRNANGYTDAENRADGYHLRLFPSVGSWEVGRGRYSVYTPFGQVPHTYPTGANPTVKMRLQAIGGNVKAKVWNAGTGEPVNWQYEYSDPTPVDAPGGIRLHMGNGSAAISKRVRWDDLIVVDPNAEDDGGGGTTPPGGPTDSGVPMPTAASITSDGITWNRIYGEDFNVDAALGEMATKYNSAWRGYDGFGDTSKRGTYTPDKVLTVHDSMLDYHLHVENGVPLVACPIPNNYFGQIYGKYVLRCKCTNAAPGFKWAFLLWPSSNNWNEGELNCPEGAIGGGIAMYAHQVNGDPKINVYANESSGKSSLDWHTCSIEWSPNKIRFVIDDSAWQTTNATAIPRTRMRWTLQGETNLGGEPIPSTSSGHILVDWVVEYAYVP